MSELLTFKKVTFDVTVTVICNNCKKEFGYYPCSAYNVEDGCEAAIQGMNPILLNEFVKTSERTYLICPHCGNK